MYVRTAAPFPIEPPFYDIDVPLDQDTQGILVAPPTPLHNHRRQRTQER